MSDRYQSLIHTPVGQLLAKNLGLPEPGPRSSARTEGDPLVTGTVARRRRRAGSARRWSPPSTSSASPSVEDAVRRTRSTRAWSSTPPASPPRTGSSSSRSSSPRCCAASRPARRVVVLGTPPESTELRRGARRAARPRGLHPLARQGGRPRRHRPARVRRPGRRRRARLDAGVPALPQVGLRLRPGRPDRRRTARPPSPRRSRTGPSRWPARSRSSPAPAAASASRSPGCCTATARRSSASTYPQAAERAAGGDGRARRRPPHARHHHQGRAAADRRSTSRTTYGGVDIVVHNAGITRDKRLMNMKRDTFASAIAVNLTAPERITAELLEAEAGQRRTAGSSASPRSPASPATSGQTNYAASKAGVIGFVDSLADELEDGITVNAVAPGLHRDQDDRRRAVRAPARSAAGSTRCRRAACRSTSPRRSPGSPTPPRPPSTATSSGSAAR